MMVRRTLIAAFAMVTLVGCALAQDAAPAAPAEEKKDDVAKLLDRVEAVRLTIKTLKADVRFNTRMEVLEVDDTYEGDLFFKVPRFLRMELKEVDGGKTRIYIVGKKYAWIYRPDKKIAERYYMGEVTTEGPIKFKEAPNPFEYGLANGIGKLRKVFDMRIAGAERINDKDATILELRPKEETLLEGEKAEVKLMFWIEDESGLPVRVREFKSRGQKVETYTLSKIKLNARGPLFGDPFEFDPPGNVAVTPFNEPGEKGGE